MFNKPSGLVPPWNWTLAAGHTVIGLPGQRTLFPAICRSDSIGFNQPGRACVANQQAFVRDEIELEVEPARDRFAGKILDESFAACALILRFRNDMLAGVACHCFTMSHRRRSHQVSVSCADVISYRICRWPQAACGGTRRQVIKIARPAAHQAPLFATDRSGKLPSRTRKRFRAEVQRCSAPYA